MKRDPTVKRLYKQTIGLLSVFIMLSLCPSLTAGESGHWVPGMFLIRDTILPGKGLFTENVLVYYHTTKLKDGDGNTIKSVTVGNQTVDVEVDLDVWAFSPAIYWIPWDFLGGIWGIVVAPTLQNVDAQAALSVTGRGIAVEESNFGFGDPLHSTHYRRLELQAFRRHGRVFLLRAPGPLRKG